MTTVVEVSPDTVPGVVEVVSTGVQTSVEVHGDGGTVVEVGTPVAQPTVEAITTTAGIAVTAVTPFEYQMPVAQTTAVIDHDLARDPVAVQVFDEDGVLCSEYSVVFTIPRKQVRLGFDVAVAALIRLI
jgi:hypothetical protein